MRVSFASLIECGTRLSKSIDMCIFPNVYDLSTIKNHVQSINQSINQAFSIAHYVFVCGNFGCHGKIVVHMATDM